MAYKRGAARAALGRAADAEADLHKALASPDATGCYGRARLELGKLALKAGTRRRRASSFGTAATLADSDNDPMTAADARRLMK